MSKLKIKGKEYLYEMYNATSTDDGKGDLETYENWLELQLLSRIDKVDALDSLKGQYHTNMIEIIIGKLSGHGEYKFGNELQEIYDGLIFELSELQQENQDLKVSLQKEILKAFQHGRNAGSIFKRAKDSEGLADQYLKERIETLTKEK